MVKHPLRLHFALKVAFIHFGVSCIIAVAAAWIVFAHWIPHPFRELVQAPKLFMVLLLVDVVCGPLLTAVLANPTKSRRELALDFGLVAAIQLTALGYGLHTISSARPIAIVFEVDRFAVVSASQINEEELELASEVFRPLSWSGPRLLGTRAAQSNEEKFESIEHSLQGVEPSARPTWWQSYELSRPKVIQRMQPLAALQKKTSATNQQVIQLAQSKVPQPLAPIFYLPLVSSRKLDGWIVLLDDQANIIGHAPVDGFQ